MVDRKIKLTAAILLVVIFLWALFNFSGRRAGYETPEELLYRTFNSIRLRNRSEYEFKLIDLATVDPQYRPLSAKPGMTSREQRLDEFWKAAYSKEGRINFQEDSFVGIGSELETPTRWASLDVTTYSIKINRDDETVNTQDMYPQFTVAKWKKRYYIVALEFGDPNEDDDDASEEE